MVDFIEAITQRLTARVGETYAGLARGELRPTEELLRAVERYESSLSERSQRAEFLDLETARRVAGACHALVHRCDSSHECLRPVQAAIEYFLLQHDGEPDDSILGFDDDLEVVSVTARVLGWELPEART